MATYAVTTTAAKVVPLEKIVNWEDEKSLVQRAQQGEEGAFEALFQLHKKRVYSVCLLIAKNVAEAEDLTQEAFLQVFRTIGSFRGDSAFSTWLYRVTVNTVFMRLRRRKSPPMLSIERPLSPDSPSLRHDFGKSDPSLAGAVDRIALRRAILELPAGCRKIFVLHAIHGYQHHEIAKLLSCSVGTSKSQLYKARMKMRNSLFSRQRSVTPGL